VSLVNSVNIFLFRFLRKRGISWPPERLSASEEGLCFIELVIVL